MKAEEKAGLLRRISHKQQAAMQASATNKVLHISKKDKQDKESATTSFFDTFG